MKRKLSPEDLLLWKNQLKDVKPFAKEDKVPETPLSKKLNPPQPQRRFLEVNTEISLPSTPLQAFGRKELRHLQIEARLDMHGMTLDEGYAALERFLITAQENGFKTVLIITGKGALSAENTLRRQVTRWIQETPLRRLVSFFHAPARQQDGGQGACYMGIRKRRK